MNKPIAVLISDIHYNINTLELADASLRQAINKANQLDIPLIVAGDLHDTKANLRGECITAMRETFKLCRNDCYVSVGNHDKINEKSEAHSLDFLEGLVRIVNSPLYTKAGYVFPYYSDSEKLINDMSGIAALKVNRKAVFILHQGLQNSNSGHYIQDKSAITKEDVAGFRVISGHYHTRQDIELPDNGKWSYIGNPYSLNFGEANDPTKGFQILMEDGLLEFVPTNLRRHRIITCGWDDRHKIFWGPILKILDNDILWIKVEGTKEQLQQVTKDWLRTQFEIPVDFKLDLIPIETETSKKQPKENLSQTQIFDNMIDSLTNTTDDRKLRLKSIWKGLIK